jgi:hypothetical protein
MHKGILEASNDVILLLSDKIYCFISLEKKI